MKKNEIIELEIEGFNFPGKSWGMHGEKKVVMKNGLPGQRVLVNIAKKRKKFEGRILEVLKKAPNEIDAACDVFAKCGGCTYQNLPYDEQLKLKESYVLNLLEQAGIAGFSYEGMVASPEVFGYRNKMEYSFGDNEKDGPLMLGLHEQGSFYNIVQTDHCQITDADFNQIQKAVLAYFVQTGDCYFHKRSHEGFLRHLVVRKGKYTGDVLINLATTTQGTLDEAAFVKKLLALELEGQIRGILHTQNDGVADVVKAEISKTLYGEDKIEDQILGLSFEITSFSFFQTNTLGAEKLYSVVRDFVGQEQNEVIYDLYCGTGTIAQVLAPVAQKVVGIELVPEAVEAAKVNAAKNGLDNCQFIAGDVMVEVANLHDRADVIILDPPRDGIHPKAIFKILDFKPKVFVYVSCKATSLARDLPFFVAAGYVVEKVKCVDMFPMTGHVETVVLLSLI
ncbi:23S rRNA (uracil(1939)-C(5))-methyltransferase RlmD [Acetobacterium woodii]|uniref:23S rRNA (Uracil-5-)-methyltransferase RumA n=1 Tax=Acetobacterium woodii (strain ATCC 29683 / DSM 1030 / JCM 2381 / KCTC 1655 / WB1) TaxID=931626 RepID=H6LCE0_ACEWD|nr:23S rRNA (uracil(1939)-C(5))-methyltransferase RlmD [Acetobacterium woodii]AFA50255.1 23S rRNA (uracil-5-)-methyltransferase RumA [Acetobacterium woodii DSM 1030]